MQHQMCAPHTQFFQDAVKVARVAIDRIIELLGFVGIPKTGHV